MQLSSQILKVAFRLAATASPQTQPSGGSMVAAWSVANNRLFGAAAAAAAPNPHRSAGAVPPGHLESDLSPNICNIGLGRRRDLTLRQDLCLWKDGQKVGLADILRGKKVILVGFPGGPICTDKMLPGYVTMADKLSSHGVDKVVAVTVDTPEAVEKLATQHNLKCSKVDLLADKTGGLIRLLGVEIGSPDATSEPRCQRFAAIVEDGILLKLRVEDSPAKLEVSDCKSMLKLWECVYPKA